MLRSKKQIPAIYLFLTIITLIAFRQLNQCDFINLDDPLYVTENVHIQNGITMEAIKWAFTTTYANFWHPLTMISHMLDVQLYGLNPHGHHLTSLLFHIANTLLLFFVFNRMTKEQWKSAFVAALFAVHPVHVESVAWVAERKDVLSTFFWMLTMAAYVFYVERPRLKSYLAVLALFILGLTAKPMVVTLPFVMLLMDYWPLRRLEQKEAGPGTGTEPDNSLSPKKTKGISKKKRSPQGKPDAARPAEHKYRWAAIRPLLVEKIPFFALIPLFGVLTYFAEGEAVTNYAPRVWISNAFVSYIIYMGKTIWPDNLAVFYPHPGLWPLWQAAGAALLLGAVTATVILAAKKFAYLAVGWLWFAGSMVPVIGIVQIGSHGWADRYTYIPLIGLFIMIAWGIPELLQKRRYGKEALFASSALILACFMTVTWTQVGYWRNNIALYDHALKVTSRNDLIHINRGVAYANLGGYGQAIEDYNRAIEINPKREKAYNNRGIAHAGLSDYTQAIEDYNRAIDINPKFDEAYNNRGVAHAGLSDYRRAIGDYNRAIEINPRFEDAYDNRGMAYFLLGNPTRAIEDYNRAIELNPKFEEAYYNRGLAYADLGDQRQAIEDYNRAIEINPKREKAHNNRGIARGKLGEYRQAIEDYNRAIAINPKFEEAYNNRGIAYFRLGNHTQAIEDFDKSISINPRYGEAYKNRGLAYAKLGNQRQATEDMIKAAGLDDEDAKNYLRSHGVNWQPPSQFPE